MKPTSIILSKGDEQSTVDGGTGTQPVTIPSNQPRTYQTASSGGTGKDGTAAGKTDYEPGISNQEKERKGGGSGGGRVGKGRTEKDIYSLDRGSGKTTREVDSEQYEKMKVNHRQYEKKSKMTLYRPGS